jgi:hypothetical protein
MLIAMLDLGADIEPNDVSTVPAEDVPVLVARNTPLTLDILLNRGAGLCVQQYVDVIVGNIGEPVRPPSLPPPPRTGPPVAPRTKPASGSSVVVHAITRARTPPPVTPRRGRLTPTQHDLDQAGAGAIYTLNKIAQNGRSMPSNLTYFG